ncbi:MAG: thiamine-phosphate kinase [Thermoplasmata archaeon]|nr:thiamine-phosphate kinase [Thermoplasmata archaeon]
MNRRGKASAAPIDERGFHRWVASHLPAGRTGALPIGDDAAALRPPRGSVAVLTTDALIEGTHFAAGSPPRSIGAAAAGVSLSDAASKGARPAGILIALLLPPGTSRHWAESVLRGAEAAGARFDAHVVGGDTKPAPVRAVISTVVGWGTAGSLAPRSGARPGDLLVTTGSVGRGGSAWRRWRTHRGGRRDLLALLDVRPRVREGLALAPLVHAMIDTSDGIADSAHLLARASRVRLLLDPDRIPWDRSIAALPRAAREEAGFFGGDYELLAAVPSSALRRAVRAVGSVGGRLHVVGRAERGTGAYLSGPSGLRPLPSAGWSPFQRAMKRHQNRAAPSQGR